MHSTVSDGSLPVRELVRAVHAAGVAAFVLTDHDSTEGWEEARGEAAQLGLDTLPGVEVSTQDGELEHHILGYGFDPGHAGLQRMLRELRRERRQRLPEIVSRLEGQGVSLCLERVEEIAAGGSAGRPHVARALVEAGHCRDVQEAFDRFIGDDRPAYVRKTAPLPSAAIARLHDAGGLAVLAHPCAGRTNRPGGLDRVVAELKRVGLDGLEVNHPAHDATQRRRLRRLANKYGLRTTGGSDFHGETTPDRVLGCARPGEEISLALFEALRE